MAETTSPNTTDRKTPVHHFFRALKIAFKTASIYAPDHPAFLHAADDLYAKLESILASAPVLTIKFTPRSLFVDGRFWDEDRIVLDLARLFHLRKIQSLEIRTGIPKSELRAFAARITRPIEEIIQRGGIRAILKTDGFSFISVEELDFSQLLKGEGEEIGDLWPYLLIEAVETGDPDKMQMFAQRLQNADILPNPEMLLQKDDVQKSFSKLFQYVKDTGGDQYRVCAKTLVRSLVAGKKVPAAAKLANIQRLLSDLREEDLASTLWGEIVETKDFDATGLEIFSQIVSRERQSGVSASLRDLFRSDRVANRRPEVKEKFMALLFETSGPDVSAIYRQTLAGLLQEMTFDEKQEFDQAGMERHYRYVLLNLLDQDEVPDSMIPILDKIAEEWTRITETKDVEFLRDLFEVLKKKEPGLAACASFQERMKALLVVFEDLILGGMESQEIAEILHSLGKSVSVQEKILDRVFIGRIVTVTLMKFLFQNGLPDPASLEERISRSAADGPLLDRIACVLEAIDSRPSLEMLKLLYAAGNTDLQMKVLSCMRSLSVRDEAFLFSVLRSDDRRLKAGALALLMRSERTRHVAFQRLLAIESPFGLKNRTILRHLEIVREQDLRQAEPYVRALISRAGFWNAGLRRAGRRILEAWHEG